MTAKRAPRKRKEVDITDDFAQPYRKNFDCSSIMLKKQLPLTDNQTAFYYLMQNDRTNMVFLDGPAGSAKSYCAVYSALELLRERKVDKIIYIRTVIESASRSMGYLKGDENEKFAAYTMVLNEKCLETIDKASYTALVEQEYIKAIPVNFARGLTFNNSLVIFDECFDDQVFVETDKGRVKLKRILKNPNLYNVLSFNELSKEFEYKPILNTFSKGKKFVSKMTLDGRSHIRSTKNHKYLTTVGWKSMEDINIGDGIISSSNNKHSKNQLNDDQKHMVIGGILGDSSLQKVNPNSYRISCIHGIKQEEYANFKADILKASYVDYVEKNGYSQKPAIRFTTGSFYLPIELENRKKYAIENLNDKSLAISWQDDGYYQASVKFGILFSCADSEELNNLLSEKLNSMGYDCTPSKTRNGEGREYFQIRFKIGGFDKMCKNISKYIHPSMSYKLPDKYHHDIGSYKWDNNHENYSIRVVSKLEFDVSEKEVYDIEVEDNHNFVVSTSHTGDGTKVVAHNCQNATRAEITTILTRFGRGTKYIVCGDGKQKDIRDSGFSDVFNLFNTEFSRKNNIHCVQFDTSDIVRSPLLKHITQVLGV